MRAGGLVLSIKRWPRRRMVWRYACVRWAACPEGFRVHASVLCLLQAWTNTCTHALIFPLIFCLSGLKYRALILKQRATTAAPVCLPIPTYFWVLIPKPSS